MQILIKGHLHIHDQGGGHDDDDGYDDDDDNYADFDVTAKQLTLQFRHRVEEVEAEKRRTEQIVEAEIKAAVEERDRVLGKCRIMREEMEKMKKKSLEQVDLVSVYRFNVFGYTLKR